MNWRRLMSSMGSPPEPSVPANRRLRMRRKGPQVLGVDLNRSERAGTRSGCARGRRHAYRQPNSAWKALGVIGPSRSVIKMCEDSPCSRCRRRSARPVSEDEAAIR
jgi:hypothetical protein